MASTAVSTGKAATIRMLVHNAVQVKIGMRIQVMPGARILTMVAIRLTPDNSVPTPAICKDQM
ncbi:hypothetical protein D3C87_1020290 [compost metagenome]